MLGIIALGESLHLAVLIVENGVSQLPKVLLMSFLLALSRNVIANEHISGESAVTLENKEEEPGADDSPTSSVSSQDQLESGMVSPHFSSLFSYLVAIGDTLNGYYC